MKRALQKTLNELQKPEEKRNVEIMLFFCTHYSNNPLESKYLKHFINLE